VLAGAVLASGPGVGGPVSVGPVSVGPGVAHAAEAPTAEIRPVAECVLVNGDGSFTAFFGYSNASGRSLRIPDSRTNRVDEPSVRPPTSFRAGRVVAAFSVTTRDREITWQLGDIKVVVTPESLPCSTSPTVPEAPLALLLMLAPAGLTGWWLHRRRLAQTALPSSA
jgi:hypothetical protein